MDGGQLLRVRQRLGVKPHQTERNTKGRRTPKSQCLRPRGHARWVSCHRTARAACCVLFGSQLSSAELPGSMLDVTRRCGPRCGTRLLPRVHISSLGDPGGALPEQGAPRKATQPSQPHPKTPGISETSALHARETAPAVRATPFVSQSKANTKPDKLLSRLCL